MFINMIFKKKVGKKFQVLISHRIDKIKSNNTMKKALIIFLFICFTYMLFSFLYFNSLAS